MLTSLKPYWKRIRATPVGRLLNIPLRAMRTPPVAARPLVRASIWTFKSHEDTNFTYPLTASSEKHLDHAVALATGGEWQEARFYIEEAKSHRALAQHIIEVTDQTAYRAFSDRRSHLHKRLGWYAVAK